MSGNMAKQLAERVGIKVASIMTHDDISAGLDAANDDRRGLAGAVAMYKISGCCCRSRQITRRDCRDRRETQ